MRVKFFLLVVAYLPIVAIAVPHAPSSSKVARQNDLQVKQLIVPGFESLPLSRKLFAYYLAEAIEAGRDIAWQQLSEDGLRVRHFFEDLWPALKLAHNPAHITALERYYFLLLLNHGPHDQNSNEKIVVEGMTTNEFINLVRDVGGDVHEAEALLPFLFDRESGRYRVARTGRDKINDSGTSFYGPGMTEELLGSLSTQDQRHFLSTPRLNAAGEVELWLHRMNGGRFAKELSRVAEFLRLAQHFATPEEKALIDAHLQVIASGDPADLDKAERLWVTYRPKDISFVIGFVETYDDPLEARGTWEGFLLLKNVDPEARRRNDRIRELAVIFEKQMPVDSEFKKQGNFSPPDSEGAHMLYFGGGHNERSFRGVNLPNSAAIREELGSQSFTAFNKVFDLGDGSSEFDTGALDNFYLSRYHNQLLRFGRGWPLTLHVEFHEILGHGSGRDRTGVDSSTQLGSDYSAMEEARAEIAALHSFSNPPDLYAKGLFPENMTKEDVAELSHVAILEFFTDHLGSYADLLGAKEIRQAHQLGRQMIFNRALRDGALFIHETSAGVPQIELAEMSALRASFARFWRDIQLLKSTGDAPGLRQFIADLGAMTPDQERWAHAITKAKIQLNYPKFTVYLPPRFELVRQDGAVSDVRIIYENPAKDVRILFEREQARMHADRNRDCALWLANPSALWQPLTDDESPKDNGLSGLGAL